MCLGRFLRPFLLDGPGAPGQRAAPLLLLLTMLPRVRLGWSRAESAAVHQDLSRAEGLHRGRNRRRGFVEAALRVSR